MSSNQEGRQAAIRTSTGTTGQAVEDWHALFDDAGIAAGSFNERMLAWINAELGTSYTNLNGAMWAYADNAGYDRWNAMATLVLAVAGAEELAGDEANAFALDFTDDYYQASTGFYGSAYILHAAKPANDYNSSPDTETASLLTYSGSSAKLTMGPSGTLRYNAHNRILNSEDLTQASWVKSTGSSATAADTWQAGTTAGYAFFRYRPGTTTAGRRTRFYARLENVDADFIHMSHWCDPSAVYYACIVIDTSDWSITEYSGAASGFSVVSSSVTAVGGGVYDVEFTCISGFTSALDNYGFGTSPDGVVDAFGLSTYTPTNESFKVHRAHVHLAPADTTYLKTTSAARYSLPFEWDTSGVLQGIRVEPAATNLRTYSNEFTNASWTVLASTKSSGAVDDIYGNATSFKIVEDATAASRHLLYTGVVAVSAGTVYCHSLYMKAGERNYGHISIANQSGGGERYGVIYDLVNGTVTDTNTTGSPTGTASGVEYVGNGWFRCWATMSSMTSTGQTPHYGPCPTATAVESGSWSAASPLYNGTAGSGIYTSSYQLESGTVATSPVISYGSTATRLADNISLAATAYSHSATVNSGLVQFQSANVGAAAIALRWDDNTSNEVVSIGHDASAVLGLTVTDGGAAQTAPLTSGTATVNTTETLGYSWKANDFLFSDNGGTAAADTSGTLPTVTTLDLAPSGGPILLRKLLVVPVEKTAAEVETYGATP